MEKKIPVELRIEEKLRKRKEEDLFRILPTPISGIDFCSNDYLGIAKGASFRPQNYPENYFGSTGSRLISGNYNFTTELENKIASFHGYPSALLFNSGYAANSGFLSVVAYRNDTIIYDELVHASLREGIRLSNATSFSFKHNDLNDLKKKVSNAKGIVFVVTESLFSMDGDFAPLDELTVFCKSKELHLIVDEAHSIGVYGEEGRGLVHQQGLNSDVFATIVTFGKAMGSHGAAVLGSFVLKEYLINYSKAFIYTTALPLIQLEHINHSYELIKKGNALRTSLQANIDYFKKESLKSDKQFSPSNSAIQLLEIQGNSNAKNRAEKLMQKGIGVKAILSPTVEAGKERIRICLHSFNTPQEIDQLFSIIND